MKFLEEITVAGCPSLRVISDLSKFERTLHLMMVGSSKASEIQ